MISAKTKQINIMKTNKLTRFVPALGITFALAASLAFSASAAEPLKGAQLLIGQKPAPTTTYSLVIDRNANVADCPACTNSTKPFSTSAGRGAFVKSGVTVTHECPACKTSITTVGAGKAKTSVAVHTCGNGAVATCCSGMNM